MRKPERSVGGHILESVLVDTTNTLRKLSAGCAHHRYHSTCLGCVHFSLACEVTPTLSVASKFASIVGLANLPRDQVKELICCQGFVPTDNRPSYAHGELVAFLLWRWVTYVGERGKTTNTVYIGRTSLSTHNVIINFFRTPSSALSRATTCKSDWVQSNLLISLNYTFFSTWNCNASIKNKKGIVFFFSVN